MGDRRDHGEPDMPDLEDEAIDLALVHADDEYLDLLSGANLEDRDGALGDFGDDHLTELLMSWRRDVDAEPIGELVDTKLATVTVHSARAQRKRRPRLLVPIAAAAAVLAIAFAGVGMAARDAQPGDTLWALTKVLYADHARSIEAAEEVRADLREARAALTKGNVDMAKSKLEDAHAALPSVLPDDGKTDLEAQHASLVARLPGNPSGEGGQPPAPDPTTQPGTGSGSSGSGSTSSNPAPSNPAEDPTSPSTPPDETTAPTSPTTSTESTPRTDPTTDAPSGGGTNSDPEGGGGENNAPANAPAVVEP